jgi:hypothetical protein
VDAMPKVSPVTFVEGDQIFGGEPPA